MPSPQSMLALKSLKPPLASAVVYSNGLASVNVAIVILISGWPSIAYLIDSHADQWCVGNLDVGNHARRLAADIRDRDPHLRRADLQIRVGRIQGRIAGRWAGRRQLRSSPPAVRWPGLCLPVEITCPRPAEPSPQSISGDAGRRRWR